MNEYRQYLIGGPRHGKELWLKQDRTRNEVYFPVRHPVDMEATFRDFSAVTEIPFVQDLLRDEYRRERMGLYPGFNLDLWVWSRLREHEWHRMAVELILKPHELPERIDL